MESSLRSAKQAITGATLLIIFLGIAMAFALGKRITDPIGQLVDASHAIGKGDYNVQFQDRRQDELGQLMNAFNDMAERIARLKQSAEFQIFTPGSSAGTPVSILASLRAPRQGWDGHEEALREQIRGTVSAILGLAGACQ